jgi:hypothetical protein
MPNGEAAIGRTAVGAAGGPLPDPPQHSLAFLRNSTYGGQPGSWVNLLTSGRNIAALILQPQLSKYDVWPPTQAS